MSTCNYFSVSRHVHFPTLPSNSCHLSLLKILTSFIDILPNLQSTGSRESKEGNMFLSNLFLDPLMQTVTKSHVFFLCNMLYFQTLLCIHALKSLSRHHLTLVTKHLSFIYKHQANNIPNTNISFLYYFSNLPVILWIKTFLHLKSIPTSLFSYSSLLHNALLKSQANFDGFLVLHTIPIFPHWFFPMWIFSLRKKKKKRAWLKWLLLFHNCFQVFSFNIWWTNRCGTFSSIITNMNDVDKWGSRQMY